MQLCAYKQTTIRNGRSNRHLRTSHIHCYLHTEPASASTAKNLDVQVLYIVVFSMYVYAYGIVIVNEVVKN